MKGKYSFLLLTIFGLIARVAFAQSNHQAAGPLILVSKSYSAKTYENWLIAASPQVNIKLMYGLSQDSVRYYLQRAQGIVISGGEDVYPKLYGAEADTSVCGPFDQKRDSLEQQMIRYALMNRLPLLGICRGLQMINVTLGGTLYRDLEKEYKTALKHPRQKEAPDKDVSHLVRVMPFTSLGNDIVKVQGGEVNSAHHQGIKQLGRGLKASATAPDGVIEAIEWENKGNGVPFMLAVQWHPERLNYSSPFSMPIAKAFIAEAEKTKTMALPKKGKEFSKKRQPAPRPKQK